MFARPYNAELLLGPAPSCIPLGGLLMMDAHSRRRRIKRAKRNERSRDETTRLESPTNPKRHQEIGQGLTECEFQPTGAKYRVARGATTHNNNNMKPRCWSLASSQEP
jgi:hypothetical protein